MTTLLMLISFVAGFAFCVLFALASALRFRARMDAIEEYDVLNEVLAHGEHLGPKAHYNWESEDPLI